MKDLFDAFDLGVLITSPDWKRGKGDTIAQINTIMAFEIVRQQGGHYTKPTKCPTKLEKLNPIV